MRAWVVMAVLGAGCGSVTPQPRDAGAGRDAGPPTFSGMPCAAVTLLAANCVSCHGQPLAGGATVRLLTAADLSATSPLDSTQTVAQRCVTRMHAASAPMPPVPPAVPAGQLSAFEAWVDGGMPGGSCAAAPPDAGPTCQSFVMWTGGNTADLDMNAGLACLSCHQGQNFNGQNPTLVTSPLQRWFFMGTVFPGVHEADRCYGALPDGVTVEILYEDGGVFTTLTPHRASGNFLSTGIPDTSPDVPQPYRARVRSLTGTLEMMTPQTTGDCNSCHTVYGEQGAPGRIVLP